MENERRTSTIVYNRTLMKNNDITKQHRSKIDNKLGQLQGQQESIQQEWNQIE